MLVLLLCLIVAAMLEKKPLIMRKGRVRASCVVVWLCTERHYDVGYSTQSAVTRVAGRHAAWTASSYSAAKV